MALGQLTIQVIHTPGHTPACVSYLIGDAVFVGDTFIYAGLWQCSLRLSQVAVLKFYISRCNGLYSLPDQTRMFLCHDYKAAGRDDFCFETTVAAQKQANIHLHQGISAPEFIQLRHEEMPA